MSKTDGGERAGTTFGPYRIGRLLGRGGMGEVYEARDTVKGRNVALKLLHVSASQDADFRQRFQRESRTAARLADPHVIPIHDYGEIDGTLYLDMRLVSGRNLAEVVHAQGPLPPGRAVDLVKQVASALDDAHSQGLVHRDVKPANVQVTPTWFAYLLDFGLVIGDEGERLTSSGLFIGSQAYAAPERFDGGGATPAGDVYSLTCLLYELLAGKPPFVATTLVAMIGKHLIEPPPKPSATSPRAVPRAMDQVIATGMAKAPADRYRTCGDLAAAADAALRQGNSGYATTAVAHVPQPDRVPPRSIPPVAGAATGAATQGGRTSMIVAVAAVAVIVLAAVAMVSWNLASNRSGAVDSEATIAGITGVGASAFETSTTRTTTSRTTTTTTTTTTPPPIPKAGQPPLTDLCDPGNDQVFTSVAADIRDRAAGGFYTSCPFALAVRNDYQAQHRPGESGTVRVFSPIDPSLGAIRMNCSAAPNMVTCTGGDNAIVYIY